ncbi:alkyl sulfatase dimerization domain-containing protein [Actinomadura nitritigenes]|uniref:alkyl sulfatase dimerization domain-containing protein n=1 Tax=Actinomadura nitritigenes TaxID=134602 RepID=UPI00368FD819
MCGLWAFDRNPTHLWELPPKESARKHVEFMGGADSIMPKARAAPSKPVRRAGPRRSSTTSCSPTREPEARDLLAQVHDRLGRGSEGGIWRNFNLQGAAEPRGKRPTNIFATLIALLNVPDRDFDIVTPEALDTAGRRASSRPAPPETPAPGGLPRSPARSCAGGR